MSVGLICDECFTTFTVEEAEEKDLAEGDSCPEGNCAGTLDDDIEYEEDDDDFSDGEEDDEEEDGD